MPTIWTHVVCVCVFVSSSAINAPATAASAAKYSPSYGMHPHDGNSLHWFNTQTYILLAIHFSLAKLHSNWTTTNSCTKVDDHSYRAKRVWYNISKSFIFK